jgi:hypothetical protein
MNPFVKWLMSPLSEWHLAMLQHKLFVGASGAAMFYYLHKHRKAWPLWKSGLAAFGTAYGVSMLLHAVRRFDPALPAAEMHKLPQQPAPEYVPVGPAAPLSKDQPKPNQPLDMQNQAPPPVMDTESDGLSGAEGIFD